jgi:2-desacetyl-2-hydroxyethyl bacteriochlorophyllide A dehydrogenase
MDGEVRIRVSRCGICGSDLHWFRGSLDRTDVCPGHEISGTVETIGTGVSGWREGDRVTVEPLSRCGACAHCKRGDYQLCSKLGIFGVTLPGGMATTVIVPAYSLHMLPDRVDLALGALAEPLAVGVHALRLAEPVRDEPVLILGAGTIGLLAAAAAQRFGAGPVTITARYAKQAEAAKALGVDRVVAPDEARETRPRPRAVIETVGGHAPTLADAVACVARGGTIAMVGLFESPPAFDPMQLLMKEARIVGSSMYSRRPGDACDFELALDVLADRGDALRPLLTHTFPLSQAQRAFETACDKSRGALKVTLAPELAG